MWRGLMAMVVGVSDAVWLWLPWVDGCCGLRRREIEKSHERGRLRGERYMVFFFFLSY